MRRIIIRRLLILPWAIWFALIVGMILLVRCVAAQAQELDTYTLQSGDDYVRLHSSPCPNTEAWLDLRFAEMRYRGKDYKACWFVVGNFVIVIDESKDKTPIPLNAFKKDVRT